MSYINIVAFCVLPPCSLVGSTNFLGIAHCLKRHCKYGNIRLIPKCLNLSTCLQGVIQRDRHTKNLALSLILHTHCLIIYEISARRFYRVIHKSFRDFQPLWYSRRDGHAEGEHVNRVRDTPSFCRTLQLLDMSNLGDANPPHFKTQNAFLFTVHAMFRHDYILAVKPASTPRRLVGGGGGGGGEEEEEEEEEEE